MLYYKYENTKNKGGVQSVITVTCTHNYRLPFQRNVYAGCVE